jgi:hypothetical protein
MKTYSPEKQKKIDEINSMTHEDMCRLWRFAPFGCEIFQSDKPFFKVFQKRFKEFGGFTPEISKKIGWKD